MQLEPHPDIEAAIAAAKIARAVLDREAGDRLETALMLLAWARTLLRDDNPETRAKLARAMFANAVWLAPGEDFDPATARLVRAREQELEEQ